MPPPLRPLLIQCFLLGAVLGLLDRKEYRWFAVLAAPIICGSVLVCNAILSNLVIDLVAGEPPLVTVRGLAKGLGGGLWITAVVVDKYIYGSLGVLTTIGLRAILGQISNREVVSNDETPTQVSLAFIFAILCFASVSFWQLGLFVRHHAFR